MILSRVKTVKNRDRGSDIWPSLPDCWTGKLENKQVLWWQRIHWLPYSVSLSHSLFSTALLSFPLSLFLWPSFARAVLNGWSWWWVSVVCLQVKGQEERRGRGINRHPAALVVPSAAGFFFHPVCSHPPVPFRLATHLPFAFHCRSS